MGKTPTPIDPQDAFWDAEVCSFASRVSRGKWVPYKHLRFLATIIQPAIMRGNARIIVNMPPRHGKSELLSHWLPAWYLALDPDRRVILASYEAEFAASWGRKVKTIIGANGSLLGLKLRADKAAAKDWLIQGHTGGMFTTGVGGPITGRGGDLIIADDLHKNWLEAHSEAHKTMLRDWWSSTLATRCEPGGSIIVVQTRWAEDDTTGWLLSQPGAERWIHVNLPAEAEAGDPMGRPLGAPLCPERYDGEALARIRAEIGSVAYAGLYAQRPAPAEGGIWRLAWVRHWDALPPKFDEKITSWDLTFGAMGSNADYCVGQVWGRVGATKYLLDQYRARAEFPEQVKAMRAMAAKHPDAGAHIVEAAANGKAAVAQLKRENAIPGLIEWKVTGSKAARASVVAPQWEAGNVLIPRPGKDFPWVPEYIQEVTTFIGEGGGHDDQVDGTSMALERLSQPQFFFGRVQR